MTPATDRGLELETIEPCAPGRYGIHLAVGVATPQFRRSSVREEASASGFQRLVRTFEKASRFGCGLMFVGSLHPPNASEAGSAALGPSIKSVAD
jgi:hypothetical protein